MRRLRQEQGMAVVAVIIIGAIILSLGMWFMSMTIDQVRGNIHQRHRQRAMDYAESGLEAAQDYLQNPDTMAFTTYSSSGTMPGGEFDYTIVRDTQADTANSTRIKIISSGRISANPATAVVESQVDVFDIDAPLVAVPGPLKISPGLLTQGTLVYGRDIVFAKPDGVQVVSLTALYYSGSLKMEGEEGHDLEKAPSYIFFQNSPNHPQRLGYAPRFPRLNETIRAYYRNKTSGAFSVLSDGSGLDGLVNAPGDGGGVYFAEGDLHLGRQTGFRAQGQFIVYVQGNLILHKSVLAPQGSWVVFLVEKDIVLTEQMSSRVMMMGTYMSNGAVRYEGLEHTTGSLGVLGGIYAGGGVDLARGWRNGDRRFVYMSVPGHTLPLPHMTLRRQYRILKGKY